MKNLQILLLTAVSIFLFSCIQDDYVFDNEDPILQITSLVDSLEINSNFQFEHNYLNNIGTEEEADVIWSSSSPEVISITEDGLATAEGFGEATLYVELVDPAQSLSDSLTLSVGGSTSLTELSQAGQIQTTSSYVLEGDFTFAQTSDGVELVFEENYRASSALPGLYIFLSNNKSSIANAFEIGEVTTFQGAHEYQIENIAFTDYQYVLYFCKPFNVKVGDGEL